MSLIRPVVAAAIAFGAATLAAAGPAGADDPVFGTYGFTADDGENATWTLTPCGDNAPGCVRVSEAGNSKRLPWSGDAHWSVGSLILLVQQPDAILCEDGSAVPGVNTYSWDGATLSGNASILTNGACGAKPSVSIPFRLTRLGAAETRPAPAAPAEPAVPAPGTPPDVPAPPSPAPPSTAPTAPAGPPLAAESSAGPATVLPTSPPPTSAPPAPAG